MAVAIMMRIMTTSLLLPLLSGTEGQQQQADCGEGEVRDLDGRCVKKVTFPPRERKSCPDIAIARYIYIYIYQT